MKNPAFAIILTICMLLPGTAPAQNNTKVLEEIIARVNNDIILKSDYDKEIKGLRAEATQNGLTGTRLEQTVNEQSKHILRNLIDKALLLQIAKEQGLTAEVDVTKAMVQLRQQRNLPSMDALETEIVKQGMVVEEFKDDLRSRFLTEQVIGHEVSSQIRVT